MASSSLSNLYCATCHLSFSDKAALHRHWKSHGQIDLSHNGDTRDGQGGQEKSAVGSFSAADNDGENVRVTPPFMAFSAFSHQNLLLQQQLLNAGKMRSGGGDEVANVVGNYEPSISGNAGRLLLPTGSAEPRGGPRPTAFHSVVQQQYNNDNTSDAAMPQQSGSNGLGVSGDLLPFFNETMVARAALFQQVQQFSSQQLLLQAAAAADPAVLNQLAALEAAGLFPGFNHQALAGFTHPLYSGVPANVAFGMNGFMGAAGTPSSVAAKMYLGQFARQTPNFITPQERLEADAVRANYNQLPFASPTQSDLRQLSNMLSPNANVVPRAELGHMDKSPMSSAHSGDQMKQFITQSSVRQNGFLDPRRNSAPDVSMMSAAILGPASKLHSSVAADTPRVTDGAGVVRSSNPPSTVGLSPRHSGNLSVAVSSTLPNSTTTSTKLTTAGLSSPKAVEQYINNLLSVNEALLQPSPVLLKKRQNTRAMGASFGGTGNLSPHGNRPVRSHSLIADLASATTGLLPNVALGQVSTEDPSRCLRQSPLKQELSPGSCQSSIAAVNLLGLKSDKEPTSTCEYCGQKFEKAGMLKLHMDTHLIQLPGRKTEFPCSLCPAVLRSKVAQQNHLLSHAAEPVVQADGSLSGVAVKQEGTDSVPLKSHESHSSLLRTYSAPVRSEEVGGRKQLKTFHSLPETSDIQMKSAEILNDRLKETSDSTSTTSVMDNTDTVQISGHCQVIEKAESCATADTTPVGVDEIVLATLSVSDPPVIQDPTQRCDLSLIPPKKRQRTVDVSVASEAVAASLDVPPQIVETSLPGITAVTTTAAQIGSTGNGTAHEETMETRSAAVPPLPPAALKFLTGSQANFKVNPVTDKDESDKCDICGKQFNKPGMLKLHMDIHSYQQSGRRYEYRCNLCAAVFRSRAALQTHVVCHSSDATREGGENGPVCPEAVSVGCARRLESEKNPATARHNGLKARPFACVDCGCAFRIHGHLAKHLRSKLHITKWECLGKLPIGTYAKLEETGAFWAEIDTKDCESSLATLQLLARKVMKEKDFETCKEISDVPKHPVKVKTLAESVSKLHGKLEKLTTTQAEDKVEEKLPETSESNGMSLACTETLSASPDFVLETPNLVMAIGDSPDDISDSSRDQSQRRRNPFTNFQSPTVNGDDLFRTSTPVVEGEAETASSSQSSALIETTVTNCGVGRAVAAAVKADVWIPPMAQPKDSDGKGSATDSPSKSAKLSVAATNKPVLDSGDRNNNSHEDLRSDATAGELLPVAMEADQVSPASVEMQEVPVSLPVSVDSNCERSGDRQKLSKCHFCTDVEFERPEELDIHLYADHIVMRDGSGFQCPRCDSEKATYPTRENLRVHIAGHFYGKRPCDFTQEPTMTTDSSDTAGRLSGSSTNSISANRHVASSPSGNSTANRKRYKTHLVKLNSIAEVPNIPCVSGGSKQILAQWHSSRTASGATSFNVSTSPDSTADSEDASLQSAVSQHSGESQESSPVNSSNPSSIQEVPMISPISSAQSKRQAFSALKRKSMDEVTYPLTPSDGQRQPMTPDADNVGFQRRCASAVDKNVATDISSAGSVGLCSSAPNVALGSNGDSKRSVTPHATSQPPLSSGLPVGYYAYPGHPALLQSQSGLLLNFPSPFAGGNGGFGNLPPGYEQLLQLQLLQSAAGQSGLFLNPNLSAFLGQQMLMPQSQLLMQQEQNARRSTPTGISSPLMRREGGMSEGSAESGSGCRSSNTVASPASNSNDGSVRSGAADNRQIFFCGLCRKSLPTQTELEEHMVSHAVPRPFVCDQCDAGFTNLPALQNHLNSHGLQGQ